MQRGRALLPRLRPCDTLIFTKGENANESLTTSLLAHTISCSNESNSTVEKNSPKLISNPSQNFLIVTIEISLRLGSIMLYAVEGVTPERYANSLIFISLSLHNSAKRSATMSFTVIPSPRKHGKIFYASAYTHLRNYLVSAILFLCLFI